MYTHKNTAVFWTEATTTVLVKKSIKYTLTHVGLQKDFKNIENIYKTFSLSIAAYGLFFQSGTRAM